MTSVSRTERRPEKKEDESKQAKKNNKQEPNQKPQKKVLKGKVVCVKFPAHSVDEAHLRKLSQPFGEIINVAMFPSLGFIELGSVEQAQNLVTFYSKAPPSEIREKMEFSISNTFNFLQSSFVVSFSPVPFGKEGQSDLINVVKRFGTPLYTMFQPPQMLAFVEMENAADAHKLVEYYSSTALRINGVTIKVSFSQEYRSLQRCAFAKPYEEESVKKTEPKRPQRTRKGREKTQSSESQEKTRSESREKTRSESREKTRSSERKSGSKETENKNESEEKAKKNVKEGSSASKEKEQTRKSQKRTSSIEGKEAEAKAEAGQKEPTEQTQDLSEGSDLEGMQVMEEHLEEEEETKGADDEEPEFLFDLENCITLDEVNESDEEERAERQTEEGRAERQTEEGRAERQTEEGRAERQTEEGRAERQTEEGRAERQTEEEDENDPRVVFLGNLPMYDYPDSEFLKLLTTFGKPVRYILNQYNRMALVEMESAAEAQDFSKKLRKRMFLGSSLNAFISEKYTRLHSGWDIRSYSSENRTRLRRSSVQTWKQTTDDSKTRSEASKRGSTEKESRKYAKTTETEPSTEDSSKTETEESQGFMENVSEDEEEGWVVYDEMDESDASEQESESKNDDISVEEKKPGETSTGDEQGEDSEVKRAQNEEEVMNKITEEKTQSKQLNEEEKMAPEDEELTDQMAEEEEEGWPVCNEIEETTDNEEEEKELMLETDEKAVEEEGTGFTETDETTNKMAAEEESVIEVQESSDKKVDEEDILNKVHQGQESDYNMEEEEEERSGFTEAEESKSGEEESELKLDPEQESLDKMDEEEGWLVSNWNVEEEFRSWNEPTEKNTEEETEGKRASKNDSLLMKGDKAVKRKREEKGTDVEETESGADKKLKEDGDAPQFQDSTEGGATEKQRPNKPIGTEFIVFYCDLCHVTFSDETKAKETHCSSQQHYRKYQEITGKNPWTS